MGKAPKEDWGPKKTQKGVKMVFYMSNWFTYITNKGSKGYFTGQNWVCRQYNCTISSCSCSERFGCGLTVH